MTAEPISTRKAQQWSCHTGGHDAMAVWPVKDFE